MFHIKTKLKHLKQSKLKSINLCFLCTRWMGLFIFVFIFVFLDKSLRGVYSVLCIRVSSMHIQIAQHCNEMTDQLQ